MVEAASALLDVIMRALVIFAACVTEGFYPWFAVLAQPKKDVPAEDRFAVCCLQGALAERQLASASAFDPARLLAVMLLTDSSALQRTQLATPALFRIAEWRHRRLASWPKY